MKNLKYFISVIFLVISVSSYSQLKVDSGGKIGIGGLAPNSNYNLNFGSAILTTGGGYPDLIFGPNPSGTQTRAICPSTDSNGSIGWNTRYFANIYGRYIYQNGSLVTSDQRLKENFRTIETPLKKLLQINGLKYDYKKEATDTSKSESEKQRLSDLENNRLGFVAQDLEKILPEAVFYDKEIDRYYIEYNALIPVLVEAMKEQQTQIEELKAKLADCCPNNLKSGSISSTNSDIGANNSEAKLYQNNPNPFSVQTTIRFEIPETAQNAQLHICNMTGTLLKTITINQRGAGNVTINANEFVAGMYLYSLVCDGKIVDTKQMLLTE